MPRRRRPRTPPDPGRLRPGAARRPVHRAGRAAPPAGGPLAPRSRRRGRARRAAGRSCWTRRCGWSAPAAWWPTSPARRIRPRPPPSSPGAELRDARPGLRRRHPARPRPDRAAVAAPARHRRDVLRAPAGADRRGGPAHARRRRGRGHRRRGAARRTPRLRRVPSSPEPMIAPSILVGRLRPPRRRGRRGLPVPTGCTWTSWTTTSCPTSPSGLPVVQSLHRATDLPLDCHLMIDDPDRWAPDYAEAGAANVTFHVEAARRPGGDRAGDPRGRRAGRARRSSRAPRSSRTWSCCASSTRCW